MLLMVMVMFLFAVRELLEIHGNESCQVVLVGLSADDDVAAPVGPESTLASQGNDRWSNLRTKEKVSKITT